MPNHDRFECQTAIDSDAILHLDAAAQLEKVADGRDLDEKLAEAGIGGSNKSSAQDVLARLQRQQGE